MSTRLAPLSLVLLALSVHGQESGQLFDAPVPFQSDNVVEMTTLLDYDGDGLLDLFGASTEAFVRVALGKADGGFELIRPALGHHLPGPDSRRQNAAAIDLDGDGNEDIVSCLDSSFVVWRSKGDRLPEPRHSVPVPWGQVQDVVLEDFDDDGRAEAVVLAGTWSETDGLQDAGLFLYGTLVLEPTLVASLPLPDGGGRRIQGEDFDGDGVDEVLHAGGDLELFRIERGAFVSAGLLRTGLSPRARASLGDVDGDGARDLVVSEPDGTYRVLRRTGPSTFAFGPREQAGPIALLADVDGDGHLDGVSGEQRAFLLSHNDGSGRFAPPHRILSTGGLVGAMDLDGDGDTDLVGAHAVFYGGESRIAFAEPHDGEAPRELHDAEGDGDLDCLLAPGVLGINRGDGQLRARSVALPVAAPGESLELRELVDLDGDGDLDGLASRLAAGTLLDVRRLTNPGTGALQDEGPCLPPGVDFAGTLPDGSTLEPVTRGPLLFGDFDGDGRKDVATNWLSRVPLGPQLLARVSVWTQQPDGSFALWLHLERDELRAVADFDGDGFEDLFTREALYFGAASSEAVASRPFATEPGSLAAFGDLDGDGDTDGLFGTRILDNLGERRWRWITTYFANRRSSTRIGIADLNADGALDLFFGGELVPVRPYGGSGSSYSLRANHVYLGSHAPGFDFRRVEGLTLPFSHLADLDGDGDLDALGDAWVLPGRRVRLEQGGTRLQRGRGSPGLGGFRPTLGAVGPFVPGTRVTFRIAGAAPNVRGQLLVSPRLQTIGSLPHGAAAPLLQPWVRLPFFASSTTSEAGSGSVAIPVRIPLAMAGRTLHHQAMLFDAAGSGGLASTNLLSVRYAE